MWTGPAPMRPYDAPPNPNYNNQPVPHRLDGGRAGIARGGADDRDARRHVVLVPQLRHRGQVRGAAFVQAGVVDGDAGLLALRRVHRYVGVPQEFVAVTRVRRAQRHADAGRKAYRLTVDGEGLGEALLEQGVGAPPVALVPAVAQRDPGRGLGRRGVVRRVAHDAPTPGAASSTPSTQLSSSIRSISSRSSLLLKMATMGRVGGGAALMRQG